MAKQDPQVRLVSLDLQVSQAPLDKLPTRETEAHLDHQVRLDLPDLLVALDHQVLQDLKVFKELL